MAGCSKTLSHLAIAVRDLDQAIGFYRDVMGFDLIGREQVADQQVEVAMLSDGVCNIELLEPLRPDSPVGRFLDKRGEGLHHIAYRVSDLKAAIEELRHAGVKMIDEDPRDGAHGNKIAFMHPRSAHGVLIELCQPAQR